MRKAFFKFIKHIFIDTRSNFVGNTKYLERPIEEFWSLNSVKVLRILQKYGGRKVFSIKSEEGKFVVKVANPSDTDEKIKKATFVFDFLNRQNFNHIPFILKTKAGESFKKIGNSYIYIMEFIEGSRPKSTEENWYKIGVILADLHSFKDYPYSSVFTFDSYKPKLLEYSKILHFGKEYLRILNTLPNFSDCPKAIIHADIGITNFILRKDDTFVLIDWDDAGTGSTVLDLGNPLISQFIGYDLRFNLSKAKSFYKGYLSKRQLTDQERDLIFDAGLFRALGYINYGKISKRWKRINYAIKNRKLLTSAFEKV